MRRRLFSLLAAVAISISIVPPVAADEDPLPEPPTWAAEATPVPDSDPLGYSPDVSESAYIATPTLQANRAGRPISGSTGDWCQGIAYGRVNTRLVLYTAAHCYVRKNSYNLWQYFIAPGTPIRDVNTGETIGTIGAIPTAAMEVDLGFIYIASGARPPALNKIFKGDGERTTTLARPPDILTCDDFNAANYENGKSIYQSFQNNLNTLTLNRSGTTAGFGTYVNGSQCSVKTTIPQHDSAGWYGVKDSGSVFHIGGWGQVPFAVGSYAYDTATGGKNLAVTPIAHGLARINDYWRTHGYQVGAWLCWSASCPSTDPIP